MNKKEKSGGFYLEAEGDRRIILSGCRGISVYTEDHIGLYTPFGEVVVYGRELEMGCMTVDGVVVTGRIQRIEFR